MAKLQCSFRGGKIVPMFQESWSWPVQAPLLGNGWRGLSVVIGVVLLVYGLWPLGVIFLGLAVLWGVVVLAVGNWRQVYRGQRAVLVLDRDVEEALSIGGEPHPNTGFYWRLLKHLFQQQRWEDVLARLTVLEEGEDREYLEAVASLGLEQPEIVLASCPPRPQGKWRMLKAQALFQAQRWQDVLITLRGRSHRLSPEEFLETNWLKGGSYYNLGQYKPAARILQQVVDQGGEGYPLAQAWLQEAQQKVK